MINVAELLKDAPKGTKLYSPLFGEVELIGVNNDYTKIRVIYHQCFPKDFLSDGRYLDFPDAECLLFPSKDRRTWEGWKLPSKPNFKVGDWLVYKSGDTFAGGFREVQVKTVEGINRYTFTHNTNGSCNFIDRHCRLWSIYDAKDGDILAADECYVIFKEIDGLNIKCYCTYHHMGFHPSFHIDTLQNKTAFKPATQEQRILFFKKMQEADYMWDEKNKVLHKIKHYDIDNFKPKQWVLVRDDDEWEWALTRFSHLSNGSASLFVCINGASFQQCIPFERNEKLLGTTDPCPKEFINW